MVLPVFIAAATIARFVAKASPAAFKVIDATCALLESKIGVTTGVAAGVAAEEANPDLSSVQAIIALRAACEVRKALRRKR